MRLLDRHGSEHSVPQVFANQATFPAVGEEGVLYLDSSKVPNPTYRWDGAAYVQVGGGGTFSTTSLVAEVYQGAAFVAAQANATAMVADLLKLSDGVRIDSGIVKWSGHGLTVGAYYYLDQNAPGGYTSVAPAAGLSQRLFFVEDANTIHVDIEPAEDLDTTTDVREVAAFVDADVPVTLDNLRISPRLLGGQGFRLATVTGTMQVNVAATICYGTDSILGSNRVNTALTTTALHPFGWYGQGDGDTANGLVFDRTNNRMYEFKVMTNVAPTKCFVHIRRLL